MHCSISPNHVVCIDPSLDHEHLRAHVVEKIGKFHKEDVDCALNCLNWFIHDVRTAYQRAGKSYRTTLECCSMVIINDIDEAFLILVNDIDEEYPSSIFIGVRDAC